mmetsp:Transcript_46098/g.148095  ORF Transcript_46098/g.148095 Transcript_46098/m.148095 type:complete len:294 (+) Transcript_46098:34-915(+)
MGSACCRDFRSYQSTGLSDGTQEYQPLTVIPDACLCPVGGHSQQPSCFCAGVARYGVTLVEELSASVVTPLTTGGWPRMGSQARHPGLELQIRELFRLHDLNGNGTLEEDELVQLNAKVALLHYGHDVDLTVVKEKYRRLFREKLNREGSSVSFAVFRRYLLQVLDSLDPDPTAQEMIAEQFALEAQAARAVFHLPSFASVSDAEFLSKIPRGSFYESRSPRTPQEDPLDGWTHQDDLGSPDASCVAEESFSRSAAVVDRVVSVREVADEPMKPRQPPAPRRPPSFMASYGGA